MLGKLVVVLVAAGVLAGSGCGKLRAEPGHDFAVRLVGEPVVTTVGQLRTAVPFAVDGCGDFETAIEGPSHALYPIAHEQRADGTLVALVPTEYLREEDHTCIDDSTALASSTVSLLVTCHDTLRTASTEVLVRYGSATRSREYLLGPLEDGSIDLLFPGMTPLDPLVFWNLGSNSAVAFHTDGHYSWDLTRPAFSAFVERPVILPEPSDGPPRLFVGSTVLMTSLMTVASGMDVPAVWLYELDALDGTADYTAPPPSLLQPADSAHTVPADVLDMAFVGGELVILSEVPHDLCSPPATVVTSLGAESTEARVLAYLPGETSSSGLRVDDGGESLSFVTIRLGDYYSGHEGTAVLYTTDGFTIASRTGVTDVVGPPWSSGMCFGGDAVARYDHPVRVSPDGKTWLVHTDSGFHLGTPDREWASLPVRSDPWRVLDAAWLTDAVAVRYEWTGPRGDGNGAVDVFELAAPHALRYAYEVHPLPGSNAFAELRGILGVGDRLALTTSTGFRILGADGTEVGGADPLPCGLLTTAAAIQTGPSTVAVAASPYVYVFDLATSTLTETR